MADYSEQDGITDINKNSASAPSRQPTVKQFDIFIDQIFLYVTVVFVSGNKQMNPEGFKTVKLPYIQYVELQSR